MSFVSRRCADLTDTVDPVDSCHPLIGLQLDLSDEVVEVSEERCKDLLCARGSIFTSGGNDILGEVGVVLVGVGRHNGGGCVKDGNGSIVMGKDETGRDQ